MTADRSPSMITRALLAAAIATFALLAPKPAPALELITESEAALPPDDDRPRGITRGPAIVVVSPPPTAGLLQSPVRLKIRFEGRGGSEIDPDSIVVTYKKVPAIDLTQRIVRYLSRDGIEVEDAAVPAGTHRIRIDVKDTQGRAGWADFTFKVAK